jgi:hypothetical protein
MSQLQHRIGHAFSLVYILHTVCSIGCIVALFIDSPFPQHLPNGTGAVLALVPYFMLMLPLQVLNEHPLGDQAALNGVHIRRRIMHIAILVLLHLNIGFAICSARRCVLCLCMLFLLHFNIRLAACSACRCCSRFSVVSTPAPSSIAYQMASAQCSPWSCAFC